MGKDDKSIRSIQPGYNVPVAALKNYIRRIIRESDVSCAFVFSDVDKGSAIQCDEEGERLLIIGLQPVYDHSVQRLIPFGSDVPKGVLDADEIKDMKFEDPNRGLLCRFTRDDDAVWVVKSCMHELEHLRQQVLMCPLKEAGKNADNVRICIDTMLAEVMPEYYHGSYHLMAHELHAEANGVLNCRSDFAVHCESLGLSADVCDGLLLDRIEREPQWYGEQYGPDKPVDDGVPVREKSKRWPNMAKMRRFANIDDACATLLNGDRLDRLTTGLSQDPKYRKPGDLFSRMSAGDVRAYAFCSTRDEQRFYLMEQMIKHDTQDFQRFCSAPLDGTPRQSQGLANLSICQIQNQVQN